MSEAADLLEVPLAEPIARVRGEPFVGMPQDLYIPPEALEVFLESFEGPLDLLLYLIRKNSLDILDIPMAELTRQYMEYVEAMRSRRLELAAEYLVMAAVLIEIKSRMLLPRPVTVASDEEMDPRAELMRRLLEYEQMKQAALKLDELPRIGREFASVQVWVDETLNQRLPQITARDLLEAWALVLARAKINQHHRITREQLSVREHMTRILRRLREQTFVVFHELFDSGITVPVAVVNFIAILELVKESLVKVSQSEAYAPLYLSLAESAAELPS
ncbi:MAG: segregation/condensation protein A [Betaproteobacteria bacterium]|nr:segregation/condensation protein A [Betaproteobacteria bacterium]MDE2621976.1 segregation/condensation protein A [Betaproteobacteria bacterium]